MKIETSFSSTALKSLHDYCFSPPAWLRTCSNFENFKKAAIPRMVKFLVESLQPGVERCHVEVFWEGLHDVLEHISTEKIKLLFNTGLSYKEAGDRGQEVIVNYIGLIDALVKREVDEGEAQAPMRILACAPLLDARHADCDEGPRLLRRRLRAGHDGCRSLSL